MTARENAETADLTLEVERLRGELEQAREAGRSQGREDVGKYSRAIGEIEGLLGITGAVPLRQTVQAVRALTEQLAEATGLLREAIVVGPMGWHLRLDAFLSRAPAQVADPGPNYACADMRGPIVTDRQAAVMWMKRAESAESKLARVSEHIGYFAQDVAAARKNREPQTGMHVPYHGPFCSAVPSVIRDLERQVRSLQEALLAPSQGEGGGGNG